MRVRLALGALLLVVVVLAGASPGHAAPEGTLTWGVHVTLVNRWLDPGETEGLITPFMVLYALHDALVKPMPASLTTPSLAEAWNKMNHSLDVGEPAITRRMPATRPGACPRERTAGHHKVRPAVHPAPGG